MKVTEIDIEAALARQEELRVALQKVGLGSVQWVNRGHFACPVCQGLVAYPTDDPSAYLGKVLIIPHIRGDLRHMGELRIPLDALNEDVATWCHSTTWTPVVEGDTCYWRYEQEWHDTVTDNHDSTYTHTMRPRSSALAAQNFPECDYCNVPITGDVSYGPFGQRFHKACLAIVEGG